jgi:hypothetical protein
MVFCPNCGCRVSDETAPAAPDAADSRSAGKTSGKAGKGASITCIAVLCIAGAVAGAAVVYGKSAASHKDKNAGTEISAAVEDTTDASASENTAAAVSEEQAAQADIKAGRSGSDTAGTGDTGSGVAKSDTARADTSKSAAAKADTAKSEESAKAASSAVAIDAGAVADVVELKQDKAVKFQPSNTEDPKADSILWSFGNVQDGTADTLKFTINKKDYSFSSSDLMGWDGAMFVPGAADYSADARISAMAVDINPADGYRNIIYYEMDDAEDGGSFWIFAYDDSGIYPLKVPGSTAMTNGYNWPMEAFFDDISNGTLTAYEPAGLYSTGDGKKNGSGRTEMYYAARISVNGKSCSAERLTGTVGEDGLLYCSGFKAVCAKEITLYAESSCVTVKGKITPGTEVTFSGYEAHYNREEGSGQLTDQVSADNVTGWIDPNGLTDNILQGDKILTDNAVSFYGDDFNQDGGGTVLMTIPAGSSLQVQDIIEFTRNDGSSDTAYQVSFAGKQGYVMFSEVFPGEDPAVDYDRTKLKNTWFEIGATGILKGLKQ